MQLHQLKKNTPNKKGKLIGRGGSRGKTSGRGHKGQKAHGGHGIRQHLKDIIKKLPKMRGRGRNSNKSIHDKAVAVNLSAISKSFTAGETVSAATLREKGVIKGARNATIKVLGTGDIAKLSFEGVAVSATAKAAIEKAGGTIK